MNDAASRSDSAKPAIAVPERFSWTPDRALEWNWYYDLYVAGGVLLLVFIAGCHPIDARQLWTNLQTGRLILTQGPVYTDPYSYTQEGQRWVNIPWAFQILHTWIYDTIVASTPGKSPRLASAALVVLAALVRVIAAFILLRIRRPGPGLWWSAVCVALAFGAIIAPVIGGYSPFQPVLGGIAGAARVNPANWSILFLALELWLIDRAASRGCRKTLLVLPPLFALWANVDIGFFAGLIVLGLWTLGRLVTPRSNEKTAQACHSPSFTFTALVWLGCAIAVMANPNGPLVYLPIVSAFRVAWESSLLRAFNPSSVWFNESIQYAVLVLIGISSFVLNARRLNLSRLIVFLGAALLWGLVREQVGTFGVVFAVTLALNGQEWYLDRFGSTGRITTPWRLWSVGGRFLTLLALFLMTVKGLTGYGAAIDEPRLGLTGTENAPPFESARFLADSPLKGQVLNLDTVTGNALIWEAWPQRRTFIDGRDTFFDAGISNELDQIKKAIIEDRPDVWRPLLDKHGITAAMMPVPLRSSDSTLNQAFAQSDDWIGFYDDGEVILYGRADSPAEDLAYFQQNRLDAEWLAFHTQRAIPSSDQFPQSSGGMLDTIFQNRYARMPQAHFFAAQRWLKPGGGDAPPRIAECLLALGEARKALHGDRNDDNSWRILSESYRLLVANEAMILDEAGVEAPEAYADLRFMQRITVLNYVLQASPPPGSNPAARRELAQWHVELALLATGSNALDVARNHLQEARELVGEDFPPELENRLGQLDEHVSAVLDALEEMSLNPDQSNAITRGAFAAEQGTPLLAIEQYESVESEGINRDLVKARLVDLFCRVGRPEKAFLLFASGNVEDPSLSTGPGMASYRQGLVYLLIGTYDTAVALWSDRSIPQSRSMQVMTAMEATRGLLRGLPLESLDEIAQLPSVLAIQGSFEYQLGFALLEAGLPDLAGDRFSRALMVRPDDPLRPLLTYYLRQMGREVPPPSTPSGSSLITPAGPVPPELPESVFVEEPAAAN